MKTRLRVKARPGVQKTEFAGRHGEFWKLRVAAPPVDGKANEAIVRYVADLMSVPPSSVRIVRGLTSPTKLLEIEGVDSEKVERAILESHGHFPDSGSATPRGA